MTKLMSSQYRRAAMRACVRRCWTCRFFSSRIDRILIAATKADHLHHESHDRLQAIVRRIGVWIAQHVWPVTSNQRRQVVAELVWSPVRALVSLAPNLR